MNSLLRQRGPAIELSRASRQLLHAAAALCLVASALAAFACRPEALPPQARTRLAQGRLLAGQSVDVPIALRAGEYVRVSVEHGDAEVELSLWAPDGRKLATGGAVERDGVDVLAAIAWVAGDHRLRIAAAQDARYDLFVDARRPADAKDSLRVKAHESLALGFRLHQSAPDRAVVELAKALALWQRAGDAEGEVDTRNGLASAHLWLLQGPQALAWAQTALDRARRAGYVRGQADALDNLGGAQSLLQVEKAVPSYREAITLWKSLGDPIEQGHSLNNLGVVYSRLNDLEQARQAFEAALPLLQRDDPEAMAYSLTGLGLVAQGQGDLDRALGYYEQARKLRPGDPTILSNLAGIHLGRGNLQAALSLYVQSLAQGGSAGLEKAEIVHNLASLYYTLGAPEKALALYEQVLHLQKDNPGNAAYTLNSIGTVLFAMGDASGAKEKIERALELSRDKRSRNPSAEAQALHNLGRLHMDGEPERALGELDQALVLRSQKPDFTARASTLLEIGTTEVKLGQLDRASVSFARALDLASRIRARALVSRCLLGQAKLERARGHLTAALDRIERGMAVVETVRSDVASDDLRTSFFAANREFYELYVALLLERGEPLDPERALQVSEQARARGLRDLLAEGRIDVDSGIDPRLKQEELALAGRLDQTEGQLRQVRQAVAPDEAAARQLEEKLLRIEQQQQVLVGRIREQNPRYAEVRYPKSLDARQIERLLDPQTALLEYAVGQERTALFVVTREGLTAYSLPLGARSLAERVGRLRRSLKGLNPALKGDYIREAAALYHDLVAPAEGSFRGKREILISPDRILHLLPFEVLLTAPAADASYSRLPYLLRRYAIAYLPSASVLVGLRAARKPGDREEGSLSFVAFANPVRPDLAPLPESEREVNSIKSLFPAGQAQLYLGQAATKANLLGSTFEGRPRIHFAVHGILNERWPQLSGLALTRGQTQEDDGFLRVHEIFNLKLNADLVVLSACDTAAAQVDGEGLVGLTRAFFYAGASSLLVSLWRVSEASTPELMVSFYRRTAMGKALALQAAKLELIGGGRYAHPFYWAPFVLVGEPR